MAGLRILVSWILPALCLTAAPKLSEEMEAKYLVHTYEMRGHRYMIEIDNDKKNAGDPDNFIYKAIGAALYNTDQYSYSEFKTDKKVQTIIYPFSGAATSGNDAFQLVHTDFKNIERINFVDWHKDNKKCKDPIMNGNNYAMLYLQKKAGDRFAGETYKGANVKHIGTFFKHLDLYKYVNDQNELEQESGLSNLIKDEPAKAARFEILCRVEHGYMTKK